MHRIAIDYTPAYEQTGGIGRYVRELTAALAALDQENEYRLFVSGANRRDLPPAPSGNFHWKATSLTPRWLARIWQRARMPLPAEVFTGRVDLYHATDFVLAPTLPGTRTLLTVHDLSFVRVPEAASPPLKAYLDVVVPRSVASADHILADSAATKADLVEFYETPAEKITVLYSGVGKYFRPINSRDALEEALKRHGLNGINYMLSVGTVQPRKNYSRVIEALAEARCRGQDLHFAIAGGRGWLEEEMTRTIERTGLADHVHLLGFVDDQDLPALYSGAGMLMMPSLYEGFGLPLLEAMACGTPVITSNLSSLPEVAGDAALLVDPYDVSAISDAIVAIASNAETRARLIAGGFHQVTKFTWTRAATQLMSIYHDMLVG